MWMSLALVLLGVVAVVTGIALFCIPAAVIVAGAACIAAGLLREDRA